MNFLDLQVELVVPVHNEERSLATSITRAARFLAEHFPFNTRLTVADNGSTDDTWHIAQRLADAHPAVRAVQLPRPGRGGALQATWSASPAQVVAYMDVDLSTDLTALLPLVAPLISGHSDVAIGTRLGRGARVTRGWKRELISRSYNTVLHASLGTKFSDAQCGFKAIRADRAQVLLPHVHDTGWFFDTELLVIAERCGLRIHEVPVDWVDDPDSRVALLDTALADLRGIVRMRRALSTGALDIAAITSSCETPQIAVSA
jgi:glycosyltransferase involved in cell wall biosynthesis